MKIFEGLSNSKNNSKNVSVGLTLRRKDEKNHASGMSSSSSRFKMRRPVFAGERVNTDIYEELLRQDVVLGG
jgi:hypothetical protein